MFKIFTNNLNNKTYSKFWQEFSVIFPITIPTIYTFFTVTSYIFRYYSIRMPTSIYGKNCAYLLRVFFQYKVEWLSAMGASEEREEEKERSDQISWLLQ